MPLSIVRAALAVLVAAAPLVHAQTALPRIIKIVVPFSAGGSNDVIARAIAAPLAAKTGSTVIVENKAGAAGVVGADFVAKSPKDGSVLLLTSSSFLTAAATQKDLPYDALNAFVRRDIVLAQAVLNEDDRLDGLKTLIFRELLEYMLKHPTTVEPALDLILVSRHLERIGDHATKDRKSVV